MPESIKTYTAMTKGKGSEMLLKQKKQLIKQQSALEKMLTETRQYGGDIAIRDRFLNQVQKSIQDLRKDYIPVIQQLDDKQAETGTFWLQSIVDHVMKQATTILPEFGSIN